MRRIGVRSGQLANLAGSGLPGFTADGRAAAAASLGSVCGIAVDKHGNLLFPDGDIFGPTPSSIEGNGRIRVIAALSGTFYGQRMRAGRLYTIAGDGAHGYSGDGGPATDASLDGPAGLAVDSAGNVIFSDTENDRIRMIAEQTGQFYGQHVRAGDIYTIAGGGTSTTGWQGGPAISAFLNLRWGPGGGGGFTTPESGLRIDHNGNLVIAASFNHLVVVVPDQSGRYYGRQMTAGHIYVIAGDGRAGHTGDGGTATKASLNPPYGLAIDHSGNVLIALGPQQRVRVVAAGSGRFYGQRMTAGDIYTLPDFLNAVAVAVDGSGDVVANDSRPDGPDLIQALAATSGRHYGQIMRAGHVYTIAGVDSNDSYELGRSQSGPATSSQIEPTDVAVDHAGNLVVADSALVEVLARASGRGYGRALATGHIYTIGGNGQDSAGDLTSGVLATRGELLPSGIAVDHPGNIVVADWSNDRVRVIAVRSGRFYRQRMRAGFLYTILGGGRLLANGKPAGLHGPYSVAVDQGGSLVIGDGSRLRVYANRTGKFYGQLMTAGDIYTIGGTLCGTCGSTADGIPALAARIQPISVRLDGSGNVLISDRVTSTVRVIAASSGTWYGQHMTVGHIYTIAGGGSATGSGGLATAATLAPNGLGVDQWGNVLVTDSLLPPVGQPFARMRVVAVRPGVFYGLTMTTGHIYTVAGTGPAGFSGDGGQGTAARLWNARAAVYWPGHGVVVADGIRLRLIQQ